MSLRARWMRSTITMADLRAILRLMRRERYNVSEARDGFGIVDDAGDFVEGVHVRFVRSVKSVELPNGTKLKERRFAVEQTAFRLACGEPGLELRNASRSLVEMLDAIRESVPNFVAEKIAVDPIAWYRRADAELKGGSVTSCTSVAFEMTNAVFGRVEVNGGESVLEQYQELTRNRPASVARLCVRWVGPEWDVKCDLTRDGRAKISGEGVAKCLATVRRTLVLAPDGEPLSS